MDSDKIKKALDFYMLVNKTKYTLESQNQSLANQIYGAMILAVAINSEYNITDNIGETIRIILFGMLNEFYEKELDSILNNLSKGKQFKAELAKFYGVSIGNDRLGSLAFDCEIIEVGLNYFFDVVIPNEHLQELSIEELFSIAQKYGFIGKIGPDNKKNYEIFKFYYWNRKLRDKIRSGWDHNHWNIKNTRVENVAEHVIGTIGLAIGIASEEDYPVDLDTICEVLTIHEIGEVKIGDITPYDGISKEEKENIEHQAMKEILGNLEKRDSMFASLLEFDKYADDTYAFARYCDKLEPDVQSRIYQDMGCHNSLSEQQNNVAFKSDKVKRILEGDVATAFDVWYEMDKTIYTNSPTFTKILNYVKNVGLK